MVLKVARMGGADWLARACAPRMRRSSRCFQSSGLTALVGPLSNFDAGHNHQLSMLDGER